MASLVLLTLFLFSLGGLHPPGQPSGATTATTTTTPAPASYSISAAAVIASAAAGAPAGYSEGSSQPLNPIEAGLEGGSYATFSAQGGAVANMTILVFGSAESAQAYIESIVSNAKALRGYSDITSALESYQHYGLCYGFGEADPEGNGAVATGVCTKGNVYIQVHVVSPGSLSSAKAELSSFVGAAYRGIT